MQIGNLQSSANGCVFGILRSIETAFCIVQMLRALLSLRKLKYLLHLQFDSAEQDAKEEAKASLDKAQAKSDLYKGRAEDADKKSTPKVEVVPFTSHLLK